jgi:Ser/Thr protein kinase RdoA (MazF antagonist)
MFRLARKALTAYDVPDVRLVPLGHVYNHTFRVVAPGGERYLLRVCHPRRASVEDVRSELQWLAALRREAGVMVPDPVGNRAGDVVSVVVDEGVPQPRLCVLYRWVPGRFLPPRTLTASHLFQVGELMACLQNHASAWKPPPGFTRRRVDNLNPLRQDRDDHFEPAIAERAIREVAAASTPQDGAVVAAAIEKVWATLRALGEGPEAFGLIHADLHHRNFLFHHDEAGAIDFDDCGYGHWLYDLAVTLSGLEGHPGLPVLREALLAGYRRSRPLLAEQERHLGAFLALRALQDILWDVEERDEPAFRDTWKATLRHGLQILREFVET